MATSDSLLTAFVAQVKDDPNLGDNFREAANALYDGLTATAPKPKSTTKPSKPVTPEG